MDIFTPRQRRDKLGILPGFKPTPEPLVITLDTQDEIDQLYGIFNVIGIARSGLPVAAELSKRLRDYAQDKESTIYWQKVITALSMAH